MQIRYKYSTSTTLDGDFTEDGLEMNRCMQWEYDTHK